MTGRKSVEKKLYFVKTNLSIYPTFYVEAVDILEATSKAKAITEYFGNEKMVGTVTTIDTPLLDFDGEDK